ncbi:predicted protein [Histoplasma capsulatum G186AR]|uniref:Uncharacterized protein n=1 Tax=Ajellomyces capsulatus (strain G186AR / H82 / ATCC MYA-2454 / RMSCC 2432) TaxID=447093 RepID=C0NER0_AJECG|nr:uncharacterized protein HCBG_01376 [Histoplasma capsulatum G186AR]EEH09731.1 predicted protein [Histoplasma capsulatum G186AR]
MATEISSHRLLSYHLWPLGRQPLAIAHGCALLRALTRYHGFSVLFQHHWYRHFLADSVPPVIEFRGPTTAFQSFLRPMMNDRSKNDDTENDDTDDLLSQSCK